MGLKECIHLAFCLYVAMRFHFKLSRGENAVPWLADAVLGCVSEAFSRHTWFIHTGTRRFHSGGLTGEAPSLSHHAVCHLPDPFIHQSGPGLESCSHAVIPSPEESVSRSFSEVWSVNWVWWWYLFRTFQSWRQVEQLLVSLLTG